MEDNNMYKKYMIEAEVYIGKTNGYRTFVKVYKEVGAYNDMEAEMKFNKELYVEFPEICGGDIFITSWHHCEYDKLK